MSDEKALLAAIWEHPHDDTPRLVYADWLQENGQPERAEFIRVQCEYWRVSGDDPKWVELEKRAKRLWKSHRKKWRAGLPSPLQRCEFHRGFPRGPRQVVTAGQFVKFSETKLKAAPLWSFSLRDLPTPFVPRVAAAPALGRAEELVVSEPWVGAASEAVETLLATFNACNLRTLRLERQQISDTGIRAFVRFAHVPHLAGLYLSGTTLNDGAIHVLSGWSGANRLRELALDGNNLGDPSLETIASGPIGQGLSYLLIGGNPRITTSGLIRLIESPAADSLEGLNVDGLAAVTSEFAEIVASSPRLQALRRLVMSNTQLTDHGLAAILGSPYLTNLQFLNVIGCSLRADGKVVAELTARFRGAGFHPGTGGWRITQRD